MSAAGGAAAAAAAAAIANAIKASGPIVKVRPDVFARLAEQAKVPVVVIAKGGLFTVHWKHLCPYKGLYLFTKSKQPLRLPATMEIIHADTIWVPE